jgi:hypothetical protein
VEIIADSLRHEPFHTLRNNCLIKSFRFKRACARRGIRARVVIAFGYTQVRRNCFNLTIPIIHGWGEVEGSRIEVARPLDEPSLWGTLDSAVKPIIAIWI